MACSAEPGLFTRSATELVDSRQLAAVRALPSAAATVCQPAKRSRSITNGSPDGSVTATATCQPRLTHSALAASAALNAVSGVRIFCVQVADSAWALAASVLAAARVKAMRVLFMGLWVCEKRKVEKGSGADPALDHRAAVGAQNHAPRPCRIARLAACRGRLGGRSWSAQTPGQRQQGDQQHRCGQRQPDAHVVTPADVHALAVEHVQPQQRGQAADGGELRAEIAADDVGVDHGFAHRRGYALRVVDAQGAHQGHGHVVHHRGQHRADEARAHHRDHGAVAGQRFERQRQVVGQPGIAQAIDHEVHAQREQHDLPRRALDDVAQIDDRAAAAAPPAPGQGQQQQRGDAGDQRHRHLPRGGDEIRHQQHGHHRPGPAKHQRVLDGAGWRFEPGEVVARGNVAAEKQHQHDQRRGQRGQIDRHHHRGVAVEGNVEIARGDDVDQIGNHQRHRGGVGDETAGHDERQRRCRAEAQRQQHGQHDGREDERRAIVGEKRRNHRTQHHDQWKQPPPASAAPTRHMQRGPVKHPGVVEDERDDDQADEGESGIPDDVPHHRNVAPVDHAEYQRDRRAAQGAVADAQTARLPDDEHQGEDENEQGGNHGRGIFVGKWTQSKRKRQAVLPAVGRGESDY